MSTTALKVSSCGSITEVKYSGEKFTMKCLTIKWVEKSIYCFWLIETCFPQLPELLLENYTKKTLVINCLRTISFTEISSTPCSKYLWYFITGVTTIYMSLTRVFYQNLRIWQGEKICFSKGGFLNRKWMFSTDVSFIWILIMVLT